MSSKKMWIGKVVISAASVFLQAAFFISVLATAVDAAPIYESGNLCGEIARLKTLVFPKESGLYVQPTAQNLSDFRALATSVENGQIWQASLQAEALGYEMVIFTDTRENRTYSLLREQLDEFGSQTKGWGNYVYDRLEAADLLIEAPHPLYDTNTPELSIEVYYGSNAKGYLMAGAHRNTMGDGNYGQANVPGHTDSIFHIVHEEWSDADTLPIQIHGFDWDKHTNFPAGTDVVLSNGDGAVPQPHIDLDAAFDDAALLSFAYNSLGINDPVNIQVNTDWLNGGVVSGGTFSSLGAGYNVQGQYTRNTYGAPWIHCELEQSIRFNDPSLWQPAIDVIVVTFGEPIPEPGTIALIGMGMAGLAGVVRRKLRS